MPTSGVNSHLLWAATSVGMIARTVIRIASQSVLRFETYFFPLPSGTTSPARIEMSFWNFDSVWAPLAVSLNLAV